MGISGETQDMGCSSAFVEPTLSHFAHVLCPSEFIQMVLSYLVNTSE